MTAQIENCQCSMGVRLCGDGCRYCQPQIYIDKLEEQATEDFVEIEDLMRDRDNLYESLKFLVEAAKTESAMDIYKAHIEEAEMYLKQEK